MCRREGDRAADRNRMNKPIKKAGNITCITQEGAEQVAGVRTLRKMNAIMNNDSLPLHALEDCRKSTRSDRLIPPKRKTGTGNLFRLQPCGFLMINAKLFFL